MVRTTLNTIKYKMFIIHIYFTILSPLREKDFKFFFCIAPMPLTSLEKNSMFGSVRHEMNVLVPDTGLIGMQFQKPKSKNRSPPLTQLPCEVKFYSIMHFNNNQTCQKINKFFIKETGFAK